MVSAAPYMVIDYHISYMVLYIDILLTTVGILMS